MRVVVTKCECGRSCVSYEYGNPKTPFKIDKCDSCGKMPHIVQPGEMGKIKIRVVTQMICPACDSVMNVKRGTKPSDVVCKKCGYKNG